MAFNTSVTSAANASAVVTLTGVSGLTVKIYSVDAFTSAGTSQLTIAEGATTRWLSPATWIATTLTTRSWTPVPFTANTPGDTVTVTAGTAGMGNTVTLNVQADIVAP